MKPRAKQNKKNDIVRIGLVQMRMDADKETNLARAAKFIRQAAAKKAQIICLPEMFQTEYFCRTEDKRNFDLADTIPGSATDFLSGLAAELEVVIVAPLFEKRARGLYHNTLVVIDADGKLLGSYRKMHIPDDPNFYEKYYFAPGDLGFKTFQTRYAKIGTLICWDQWYPEAARLTALEGAEILFYPTAIGWHESEPAEARKLQRQSWQTIQNSHAVANAVFVAAANRTGQEKKLKFWGSSFVTGPDCSSIAQGSVDREEVLIADCDLGRIEKQRREWPFLRDRRIDAYANITRRYGK
ncbi:MAG: carbon-nitrogen hydrolase [Candidatus Omnitrophica bacterium]|jgi:N-carbamoylputrescine amidase|nr:carbon-nitrogen hydrolase [Candidatus Omnitrophota bacterium]